MHTIATVSLGGDLIDKLDVIAEAGFDGVEIFEPDIHESRASPREIGAHARALGLTVVALQPFRDVEASGDLMRQLERLEVRFVLMDALGTDLLLICSNTSRSAIDDRDCAAADLRIISERAEQFGYRIGFEALAWGQHIRDFHAAWDVVRRVNHPACGLVLDSFHLLVGGAALDGLGQLPAGRIFLVQLADAPERQDKRLLEWSRRYRCFPGEGALALKPFFAALQRIGYAGPLSLEVFNARYSDLPNRAIAHEGKRALDWADAMISGGDQD